MEGRGRGRPGQMSRDGGYGVGRHPDDRQSLFEAPGDVEAPMRPPLGRCGAWNHPRQEPERCLHGEAALRAAAVPHGTPKDMTASDALRMASNTDTATVMRLPDDSRGARLGSEPAARDDPARRLTGRFGQRLGRCRPVHWSDESDTGSAFRQPPHPFNSPRCDQESAEMHHFNEAAVTAMLLGAGAVDSERQRVTSSCDRVTSWTQPERNSNPKEGRRTR